MSYDADELLGRMRGDAESDWPSRLLRGIRTVTDRVENPPPLTGAQTRHLQAAAHGLQSDEIGVVLGTSEEVVKTHLQLARRKLRAKNTTHACCIALRRGLIT